MENTKNYRFWYKKIRAGCDRRIEKMCTSNEGRKGKRGCQ